MINKDALKYKDLIFTDETMYYANKQNVDLSKSYIIPDDTMISGYRKNKKVWRDEDRTKKFPQERSKKQLTSFSESFSILNKDRLESDIDNNFNNTHVTKIFTDKIINDIESFNSFVPFDIKYIFLINDKLKVPKNEPLWYINCGGDIIRGPISTKEIENLYINKKIDGKQLIRLIDNLKIKNKPSYNFFKLKELEDDNFIKNIEVVKMDKQYEILEKLRNELDKKETSKKKFEDFDLIQAPIQIIKQEKKTIQQANVSKMVITFNNGSILEDKDEENNAKKKNKKKKGKLVDLDVKTGFFTLTEQEKNYEPLIVAGDIEK